MDGTSIVLPKQVSLTARIVRGAFGGLLTSVLANGFLFIGQLIIPRALSREGYAEFTVSISFVALLSILADLGITPMLMREFAGAEEDAKHGVDRRGELLGSAIALRFVLSLLVAVAVVLIAPMIYAPQMVNKMAIVLLSLLISSRLLVVRAVGEAFLRAHGKYYLASSFALIDAITFAVVLFVSRTSGLTVSNVLWIYVLCNVPGFLLLIAWIMKWSRTHGVKLRVDRTVARKMIVLGAPLTLGTAFLTIHSQADTLLLDRLSTPYEVSGFAAMVRLSAAVFPIPAVLGGVIAPELTKLLRREDHDRSKRLVDLSLRLLLIAAGAIALFLLPSSATVANLFLGEKYVASAPLLKIVGWMLVPIFLATFVTEMSIAAGKFWPSTVYTAYIMVAVIVGDLLLIPQFGAEGAMFSKLFAVASGVLLLLLLLRRLPFMDLKALFLHAGRIAFAVAVALSTTFVASYVIQAPVLISLAVLAVYTITLLVTRAITISEVLAIRSQFTGRTAA